MNELKNKKIKETLKATKDRRKNQICRVFELKVDKSKLNKKTKEDAKLVFLESKWIYNYALSQEDIFKFDDKISEVQIKVKDEFETREIKVLGSQLKQSVIQGVKQNVFNLSKSKKKGNKVGALNFISHYDSINLKQYGVTYTINKNSIKVQGIKQKFRVRGVGQLEGYEIANAKFIQRSGDYYFHVTCYMDEEKFELIKSEKERLRNDKNNVVKDERKKTDIGIDFGLSHQATISNGKEGLFIDYQVDFPERLKKLYRELSRKKLHSANWYKQLTKIRKEFDYLTNSKEDVKNKLCNIFKTEFENVFYQNDNFRGWQRIWGRKMLSIGLGGITARLKKSATSHQVDRFFPSTKKCSRCHNIQNMSLKERIYDCNGCGYIAPRDYNSADNILFEGLKKIGMEYAESTPVEMKPLLSVLDKLKAIPRVKASFVREAGSSMSLDIG